MSALDRFIEEAAVRFDLGYRARSVVGVLVGWIASHPLGLDGLEQQFEQAGLGVQFRSWQNPHTLSRPILASELEHAVGTHALATLARRAGFPPGTFRVITCELLPALIGLVTPPDGHARVAAGSPRPHLQRRRISSAVPSHAMHGLAVRGMLWLLVGVALVSLTGWVYLKTRAPHRVAPSTTEQRDAQLSLQQHGDRIHVQGRLPSEAARRQLWNALASLHGKANVRAEIALDPATRRPRWLDRLSTRLPQLAGDGLVLTFQGDQLQVDTTTMDPAQRLDVSRRLRRDFADLHTTGLWGPGLAALANLPAPADPSQVVDALNKTTLTFHPGSTALTGDCGDTVQAVAAALSTAPAGTRIEVGAHTDSRGDAAADLLLSQQRADTLTHTLQAHGVPATMLVAVGHGQQHPLADNRSDEGRARNRRIRYTLLSSESAVGSADLLAWQTR
jgi:outer membrane protein OmpA-like peptidoglycan-associated protein/uncharacterized protein YidB (DUF937 family)